MHRYAALIGLVILTAASAQAQRPIQWISNASQGVEAARKADLPLMFYITGNDGNSQQDDILEAQQNAFRDPLVVSIAQQRFIPVRLALSTQTNDMLQKLGAPTEHGKYLLFATPEMTSLGTLQPTQVADRTALAQQMTLIFRKFRKQVYDEKIKPKLESPEADDAQLSQQLKRIEKMLIVEADADVVKLIEGGKLSKKTHKQACGTLADLSTRPAIQALLKAALANDKVAEAALYKCTAGAAEYLIPTLNSENDEEFVLAYQAMVKICNLGKPKPKGFWFGKNDRLIDEELDRVEKGVKNAAQKWRAKYEAYR